MYRNDLIEVKYRNALFLTHGEMQQLLKHEPVIWRNSLQRGKHIIRSRKQKERENLKMEREGY